jgi:hypothetical protein
MNEIQQLQERVKTLESIIHQMVYSDRYVFSRQIQMLDGRNFQFAVGTGTKFGTGSQQKIAFYGATPIVQPNRPTDAAGIITVGTALGIWN